MYKYGDRGGAALCRDIDQAARRPAGSSSPESLYAVADEPVERHEDDLEAGDGARAFFGLVVGFLAAPLGVPATAASRRGGPSPGRWGTPARTFCLSCLGASRRPRGGTAARRAATRGGWWW